MVALDKAGSLIEYAQKEFKKNELQTDFVFGDMLDIDYENEFDLCVIFSGTFGLFSDEKNRELLHRTKRALKANGRAFIDYCALEYFAGRKRTRTWHEIESGFSLSEKWFDVPTSTYRTTVRHVMKDGRIIEPADEHGYHANEVIRCYGAKEMEMPAASVGLTVTEHLTRKHK